MALVEANFIAIFIAIFISITITMKLRIIVTCKLAGLDGSESNLESSKLQRHQRPEDTAQSDMEAGYSIVQQVTQTAVCAVRFPSLKYQRMKSVFGNKQKQAL